MPFDPNFKPYDVESANEHIMRSELNLESWENLVKTTDPRSEGYTAAFDGWLEAKQVLRQAREIERELRQAGFK